MAGNFRVMSPTPPRADVNEDGTVNILDLVLIAQRLDVVSRDKQETEIMVNPVRITEPAVAARPRIDFAAE